MTYLKSLQPALTFLRASVFSILRKAFLRFLTSITYPKSVQMQRKVFVFRVMQSKAPQCFLLRRGRSRRYARIQIKCFNAISGRVSI